MEFAAGRLRVQATRDFWIAQWAVAEVGEFSRGFARERLRREPEHGKRRKRRRKQDEREPTAPPARRTQSGHFGSSWVWLKHRHSELARPARSGAAWIATHACRDVD